MKFEVLRNVLLYWVDICIIEEVMEFEADSGARERKVPLNSADQIFNSPDRVSNSIMFSGWQLLFFYRVHIFLELVWPGIADQDKMERTRRAARFLSR